MAVDGRLPSAVLALRGVSFVRDGRTILAPLDWTVEPGQRWLVLGANGSGKTTIVRIAALYEHPSSGIVDVLGERLGATDVRVLRRRIGYLSPSFAAALRPALRCLDVVMTARYAAMEPWWHHYTEDDEAAATRCLQRMGVAHLAEQPIGTVSSGEHQRVLLARTLMNEPGLILLDEPSARLDLGGREQLVTALGEVVADPTSAPLVLVTHHLDEVPVGMTHVMMLRDGVITARGPIGATLDPASLSECFGMPLEMEERPDGRLTAWATPARGVADARR